MQTRTLGTESLSPWWKQSVILILVFGFTVLIWLTAKTYKDAPPIPETVVSPAGETVFTRADILAGQQVFLKYALMENGTIWGHGAYLGPDFSAEYLHTLADEAKEVVARQNHNRRFAELSTTEQEAISAEVRRMFKQNRYDPQTATLTFTPPEVESYRNQISKWTTYFSQPTTSAGLPAKYLGDPKELEHLTAFFAWTAWASAANRPDRPYSYTNNFPYDPTVGNTPTSDSVLWSALSLVALLAGIAAVLTYKSMRTSSAANQAFVERR